MRRFIPALILVLVGCGERNFTPTALQGSQKKPSEPFFEGERSIPLKPYKLPEVIQQRLEKEQLEEPTQEVAQTTPLKLTQAAQKLILEGSDFKVDLDQKKMKFTGLLKDSKDQLIEEISLEGNFNPKESLWTSDDLFATDPQVRAEKRMQATAVCLDTNVCDRVAVRFYIQFEDELLSLHFEKDAVSYKEAKSGDDVSEIKKTGGVLRPPKAPTEPILEEEEVLEEESIIEYSGPTLTPSPKVTQDSVKGIERYVTPVSSERVQAILQHTGGRLQEATEFPLDGPGFTRRDRAGSDGVYGADIMVSLVKAAAHVTHTQYSNRPPVSVGNISQKTGGQFRKHSSHQNGLDVDIAFPRKSSSDRAFWRPLKANGNLSSEMDLERMMALTKGLVCSKRANKSHVMAIFIDRRIKRKLCEFATRAGEDLNNSNSCAFQALRSMKHEPGHDTHFHVRVYCPGTVGCKDSPVSLPNSTGC